MKRRGEYDTPLLRVRERAGLAQSDVAAAAKVSQSAYCRYERWEAVPDVKAAFRIGHALGVEPERLNRLFGMIGR